MADHELDTNGTVCPMPAFKTKAKLGKMAPGETLQVTGDFAPAVENIVRIAEKEGATVIEQNVEGDNFSLLIKK